MDCKTARNLLQFIRPHGHDLDAADHAALQAHLAECTECDAFARAERQHDAHVGAAIRDVPVPAGLKDRLLSKLKRQREDWWKQSLNRVARYAAAAAAVVLVVWIGFQLNSGAKPRPTEEDLIQVPLASWAHQPPTASDAQEWFRKTHPKLVVPSTFNYEYLVSYSVAPVNTPPFDGREVPQLFFVRSSPGSAAQVAQVFILSPDQFDLSNITQERQDAGGYRVKVKVRPENNQAYVIAYTGNLDDLLSQADTE
jgi:hypothetical protein